MAAALQVLATALLPSVTLGYCPVVPRVTLSAFPDPFLSPEVVPRFVLSPLPAGVLLPIILAILATHSLRRGRAMATFGSS